MFEILVLANLMLKPCSGYEFKRHQKVLNPNNNKIYPLLKKFTHEGLVIVRSETQSDRPARKVYEITDAGRQRFVEKLRDFPLKEAHLNDNFYLRVAFFSLLPIQDIDRILQTRRKALSARSQLATICEGLIEYPDCFSDILFLQNYLSAVTQTELRFVDNLRKKYGLPVDASQADEADAQPQG